MCQILLLIVKILGILLLSLLALCLLLLILVLFVPVRYSGKGSSFHQMQGKITVSWLLHLVHVSVLLRKEKVLWKLRVCGIPIKSNGRRACKDGDQETIKYKKDPKGKRLNSTILLDGEDEISTEDAKSEQEERNRFTEGRKEASDNEPPKSVLEIIQNKLQQIVAKIKEFWKKLRHLKESLSRFLEWWRQEATLLAFVHCKEELWRFLKQIRPRSYNVDLRFGTGDPASTGQIVGILGALYPVTKGRLQVTPEFQEKVFQGVFACKGRIQVYKLLAIAWRVYRDKNVREAYNTWKDKKAA